MRFITCLILGGFPNEELWLRRTLPGFFRHSQGDLLVIDNSATIEGRWRVCKLLDHGPRIVVVSNPAPGVVWSERCDPALHERLGRPAFVKQHGSGYNHAIRWCREHSYQAMLSFEADCVVTGPWQAELLKAVRDGALMAGGLKLGYGPLHHVPACYAINCCWPSFEVRSKSEDRQNPRWADLYRWIGEESGLWDCGQHAWFWAACMDRAVYVPSPNIRHCWMGSQRPPSPEELT